MQQEATVCSENNMAEFFFSERRAKNDFSWWKKDFWLFSWLTSVRLKLARLVKQSPDWSKQIYDRWFPFTCPVFFRRAGLFSDSFHWSLLWWLRNHQLLNQSVIYIMELLLTAHFLQWIHAKGKGASGFEPETSWSAVKCSTTELYPLWWTKYSSTC